MQLSAADGMTDTFQVAYVAKITLQPSVSVQRLGPKAVFVAADSQGLLENELEIRGKHHLQG